MPPIHPSPRCRPEPRVDHVDQAIDLFRKAIAANPRLLYPHLNIAGVLGLRGGLDEARAELSESLGLNLGLRRAGFPEE